MANSLQERPFSKTQLFCSNLPWSVNTKMLRATFEVHGEVLDAFVAYNGRSSRGFGYVTFKEADAAAAVAQLNGVPIGADNDRSREIRVEMVRRARALGRPRPAPPPRASHPAPRAPLPKFARLRRAPPPNCALTSARPRRTLTGTRAAGPPAGARFPRDDDRDSRPPREGRGRGRGDGEDGGRGRGEGRGRGRGERGEGAAAAAAAAARAAPPRLRSRRRRGERRRRQRRGLVRVVSARRARAPAAAGTGGRAAARSS